MFQYTVKELIRTIFFKINFFKKFIYLFFFFKLN